MSASTVTGQKYLAAPQDNLRLERPRWMIFFPDFELNIDEHGTVTKTKKHFETLLRWQAEEQFTNNNNAAFMDCTREQGIALVRQMYSIGDEADRQAITEIQYPRELIDRIQTRYTQRIAFKNEITELSQRIFGERHPR